MPHHLGPHVEMKIVMRKVFEDFGKEANARAWSAACEEQPNDSFREIWVNEEQEDEEQEYLRQWLLKHGAEESDECVLIAISW